MDNQQQDLVWKFLRDELSEEEKKLFAQHSEDEAFMELLQETSAVAVGRAELKNRLRGIAEEERKASKPTGISRRLIFSLAAAACLALLAVVWVNKGSSIAPAELYSAYYEPYPSLETVRGEADDSLTLYQEAMKEYEEKEFQASIDLFTQLAGERDLSAQEKFYFAQSYLAKGDYAKAEPYFKGLLNEPVVFFAWEAEWYLALLYLKINKVEEAKTLLTNIAGDNKNGRRTEAKEILKKL